MIKKIKKLLKVKDVSSSKTYLTSGQIEVRKLLELSSAKELKNLNNELVNKITKFDKSFVLDLLMVLSQMECDHFRGFAWAIFNEDDSVWGKQSVMLTTTILKGMGDLPTLNYEVPKYRIKLGATVFEPSAMMVIVESTEIQCNKEEYAFLCCLATKSMGKKISFATCKEILENTSDNENVVNVLKNKLEYLCSAHEILKKHVRIDGSMFEWLL
ncbi:MAG: hypothetical protein HQL31_04850 [Planctomycetes bacterium]|nr:hypothetical protein [Planctomycetota bacterium]